MAQEGEKPKENYLKIPNHILNNRGLGKGEKMLLAHIYSFGIQGCWQSNETLGKMFYRSTRTISLWVANLKKGKHITIKSGKGYFRTMYANSHPEVKESQTVWYRGQEIPKHRQENGQKASVPLRKILLSKCAKSCEVSAQKSVFPVRKELLPTNNTTTKETNGKNTATPSHLPAGGQAPALLQDRRAEQQAKIQQFKSSFGSHRGRRTAELTPAEREQQRQEQKKALLATQAGSKDAVG